MSPAETRAAITKNWLAFFDGSTAGDERICLLENGDQFEKEMATVDSSPLAKQVSAQVASVKIDGPAKATVTYTLLLNGGPVLQGVKGGAVLEDGTWKVGATSFCQLAALQGAAPKACPPAAG